MNSKLYNVIALVAVLAVGSTVHAENLVTKACSATVSMITDGLKNGYAAGSEFAQAGKELVYEQAKNLYQDPKGAAIALKDFAVEQGKNLFAVANNNRLATAGVVLGLGATAVAIKYSDKIGAAFERAKINGKRLAVQCTTTLDPVKQAAVATAKFVTKAAVVGTVLAAPVIAAAFANESEVSFYAHNFVYPACNYVTSLFARA